MDPVTTVLVPGFLGGLVIAVLYVVWQRRRGPTASLAAYSRPEPLSIDAINFSSLKVAGIGGLGLVAMAAAVAIDVRRIGETIAIGFLFGVVIAAVLIIRRRRTGSLPSSGRGLGANTVLSIDAQADREADRRPGGHGAARIHAVPAAGR